MTGQRSLLDLRTSIYEREWDHLLILDACRYDFFERQYESYLRGELRKVRSSGSSTPQFLSTTFDEPLKDVVYVSANPFVSTDGETALGFDANELFHAVLDIWQTETDPERGAVPPLAVNDAIRKAAVEYPGKRVIGHYIQPHIPFVSEGKIAKHENFILRSPDPAGRIGEWRNELDNRLKFKLGKGRLWRLKRLLGLGAAEDMEVLLDRDGQEGLKRAYRQNVDAVLFAVRDLLPDLDGEVSVTADHGELLGEQGHYGHKWGSSHPDLCNVPWLDVDAETSLSVDPPAVDYEFMSSKSPTNESTDASQRLRDLGYV